MLCELIRNESKVKLSDVSVGLLLRKLGLSPQKPSYRAYQQDEVKVVTRRVYLVLSDYNSGTTWAPSQTPVVGTTGARFSINMTLGDQRKR